MIKKRHYVPVTSVIKCSLLPVNQAWETKDWGNPEILNRLIRQSQDICDLWTFTSTNNSIHKLASESQESTAFKTEYSGLKASSKYEQCYAQLTNDSGYDVSLQKTFLTSKQSIWILAGIQKKTLQTLLEWLAENLLKDNRLHEAPKTSNTQYTQTC